MIRNYLKIAVRNLLKYKFISFINLFGLTVGLCCCLLILGFIIHELSYDRYHGKADNIYRVHRTFINTETGVPYLNLGAVAPPVGPLLQNDFSEIQQLTSVFPIATTTLHYEDKVFNEEGVFFADEQLFKVFDVEVISGNADKALAEPFSVMLTEEMAVKYFGNQDPVNKVIRLDNHFNFKVSGVYRAFPENSHLHPQILLSYNTLKDSRVYGEEGLRTNWGNNSFYTYLLLAEGYNPESLEAQFPAFLDRHLSSENNGLGSVDKASNWTSLYLTALTDIHLRSDTDGEIEENGNINRVYIFSAIALFILLIACINFMNLSTARSVLRAKEIGVRKAIGAGKGELILQFLSESVLISWVATILAIILCWIAFPLLNQLSGQNLSIHILLQWEVLLSLLLIPFVVGILSGLYPAFFLSSFQPVKVLKGIFKTENGGLSFRQALVIVQFSISIILIISTLVVYQQLQYVQDKELGFDKDQIITFRKTEVIDQHFDAFRTQLLASGYIKDMGRSSLIPSGRLMNGQGIRMNRGDSLAPVKANIRDVQTDDNFFSTYGIELLSGRLFSKDFGADTSAFIVNEAAIEELGLASLEDPTGLEVVYGGKRGTLVGVVKDFHFESMHHRILPIIFYKGQNHHEYQQVSVKISGHDVTAALDQLERSWNSFDPEIPFEYNFLDEHYASLYEQEQRQGKVFTVFACIAIAISCLGLFGLSAFTIGRRIKEIGIRKVLGAENLSIVLLLSKDFLKLILFAALIAFPLAWYAMHRWLEDFAYRIDFPLLAFLTAGLTAALIAFITVGYQAGRAAMANPVKNLRTE